MKNILIALVVLIVVGIATYLIVLRNPDENVVNNANLPDTQVATTSDALPATGTIPAATQPGAAASAANSVVMRDMAFSPASLTVKAGTKVTWTNSDGVPHSVVSDAGATLLSPRLSAGQSFSFTFLAPGTYAYHCGVHPTMKGTVTVTR